MSKAAREWMKRQKIEDRSLMNILDVLTAHEDDGTCQIKQSHIAKKLGVADRTVLRGLSALEALGVIDREKTSEWGKKGRATDLVFLRLDLDFKINKADVLSVKSANAFTGQNVMCAKSDLTDKMSCAPATPYIRNNINVDYSALQHRCKSRVHFEKATGKWRARLRLDDAEIDLGRHESKDLAEAEINVAIREIEFTLANPVGTPLHPKTNHSLKILQGEEFCNFLFGSGLDRRKAASRVAVRMGSGCSAPSGAQGQSPAYCSVVELDTWRGA